MTGPWLLSYLILWILVLSLVLIVAILTRQLGVLYLRLGPVGARMSGEGPEIDDSAPEMTVNAITGNVVRLGGEGTRNTLLVFVAPTCKTCTELAGGLRSIHANENAETDVVIVSLRRGEVLNREFVKTNRLEGMPYIVSLEVGLKYSVSTTPYAILIDKRGLVRAKGIVNHMVHLESLLNAYDAGHASIQSLATDSNKEEHLQTARMKA